MKQNNLKTPQNHIECLSDDETTFETSHHAKFRLLSLHISKYNQFKTKGFKSLFLPLNTSNDNTIPLTRVNTFENIMNRLEKDHGTITKESPLHVRSSSLDWNRSDLMEFKKFYFVTKYQKKQVYIQFYQFPYDFNIISYIGYIKSPYLVK